MGDLTIVLPPTKSLARAFMKLMVFDWDLDFHGNSSKFFVSFWNLLLLRLSNLHNENMIDAFSTHLYTYYGNATFETYTSGASKGWKDAS